MSFAKKKNEEQLGLDFSGRGQKNPEEGYRRWKEELAAAKPFTQEVREVAVEGDLFAVCDEGVGESGFLQWQEEQRERLLEFAHKLGFPVGKQVEVVLKKGLVLRGRLRIGSAPKGHRVKIGCEKSLRSAMPLLVEETVFFSGDVVSCVRVD